MILLYSSEFVCDLHKTRLFDMDLRLRPRLIDLYDIDILISHPEFKYYDTLINTVRSLEGVDNLLLTSKEDAASFFSLSEKQSTSDFVQSTYISADLKVVSPISETLNKPLSNFDEVLSVSKEDTRLTGTDTYVALNFMDVPNFENIEFVRTGLGVVVTGNTASTAPTTTAALLACYDIDDIRYSGIAEGCVIPANALDNFCVFYYGVFYAPLPGTYYFQLSSADVGNLQINDDIVCEQWSDNTTAWVEGSIDLDAGFHTIIARAEDLTSTDALEIQFKRTAGGSYVDLTVANCLTNGMTLWAMFKTVSEIEAQGSDFFEMPDLFEETSLNSLYIEYYKPVVVLAKLNSPLLQKELIRMKYLRTPTTVTNSLLYTVNVSNAISVLYANAYNIGYADYGVEFDLTEAAYITYEYSPSTAIDTIEFADIPAAGDATFDDIQSTGFALAVANDISVYHSAKDLADLIDLEASDNISGVDYEGGSTKLFIFKEDPLKMVRIAFTSIISVNKITISDPITDAATWGLLTSFRVTCAGINQVKLIDPKGTQTPLTKIDSSLVTIDYDDLGAVPAVYKPKDVPRDVQYGSEFIMFALKDFGIVDPIELLGNSYKITNSYPNIRHNIDTFVNIGSLTFPGSHLVNMYSDVNKTTLRDWTYVCYNTASSGIQQTNYNTFTVTITNPGGSDLVDYLIDATVPNLGSGYTATISGVGGIAVCAVNRDGTTTSGVPGWNGTAIRMVVPNVPAGGTRLVTVTSGGFSDPASVTGSTGDAYSTKMDLLQLPIAVVRTPSIEPAKTDVTYAMKEGVAPAYNNAIQFDVPENLTLSKVVIIENEGTSHSNVRVVIDVADIQAIYNNPPLVAVDIGTRLPFETVGINLDGSIEDDFYAWDGYKIGVIIPTITIGMAKSLLIRVGMFTGDKTTYNLSIDDNMSHFYKFSGDLRNTVDNVFATNHGAILDSDRMFKYHRALTFLGTDYTTITGTPNSTDFSIAFWVQTESPGTILMVSDQSDNSLGVHDREIVIDNQGRLNFRLWNTGPLTETITSTGGLNVSNGNWHFVVVTVESGVGSKMYINSNLVASGTFDSSDVTGSYTILGSGFDLVSGVQYFTGTLDELRIYTAVLDQDEITRLYDIYDGSPKQLTIYKEDVESVEFPANTITTLLDISNLAGTPLILHKYMEYDETIIRTVS